MKYRKKIIGAKIESTYGTDAQPGGADAIQATDIEITPLAGEQISRDIEYPYYGNSAQIQVNTHQMLKFGVELAGSGAPGKVPGWGVLMRACGMSETITEGEKTGKITGGGSVEYAPVSENEESITLYFNLDGQLHKLPGARGTWSLEINSNTVPKITFSFTGLWANPISASAVTPNFILFKKPTHASNENTPSVSLHGLSPGLTAVSYDHANEIIHRELIGANNEVLITDRAPTGSITIDAPDIAIKNYFTSIKDGDTGVLTLQHGKTAGNIVELFAPVVQLNSPQFSESNGIAQLQMSTTFLPNQGNDEMIIKAR